MPKLAQPHPQPGAQAQPSIQRAPATAIPPQVPAPISRQARASTSQPPTQSQPPPNLLQQIPAQPTGSRNLALALIIQRFGAENRRTQEEADTKRWGAERRVVRARCGCVRVCGVCCLVSSVLVLFACFVFFVLCILSLLYSSLDSILVSCTLYAVLYPTLSAL